MSASQALLTGEQAPTIEVDHVDFSLSDNIEWKQLSTAALLLGDSSLVDHLKDNLALAGNQHNQITVPKDKPLPGELSLSLPNIDNMLSELRQIQYIPITKRFGIGSSPLSIFKFFSVKHGMINNFIRRIQLLWNSMPQPRGPAENWAFFIYYPNWWFGRLANVVGYVFKGVGDGLSFFNKMMLVEMWDWFKETLTTMLSGSIFAFLVGLIALPFVSFALIASLPLVAAMWLVAQPFYFLANTINYLKHFFDALSNLCVSIMAWAITKRFDWFEDDAIYTDISYSIKELVKYGLKLAPLVLFILFSVIPFTGGPVGAFIAGVVLKIGVTTASGAINLAIPYGLMVGYQAYGAAINFCEGLLRKWFFSPAAQETPLITESALVEDTTHANMDGGLNPSSHHEAGPHGYLSVQDIARLCVVPDNYEGDTTQRQQYQFGFRTALLQEAPSTNQSLAYNAGFEAAQDVIKSVLTQTFWQRIMIDDDEWILQINLPVVYQKVTLANPYLEGFLAGVKGDIDRCSDSGSTPHLFTDDQRNAYQAGHTDGLTQQEVMKKQVLAVLVPASEPIINTTVKWVDIISNSSQHDRIVSAGILRPIGCLVENERIVCNVFIPDRYKRDSQVYCNVWKKAFEANRSDDYISPCLQKASLAGVEARKKYAAELAAHATPVPASSPAAAAAAAVVPVADRSLSSASASSTRTSPLSSPPALPKQISLPILSATIKAKIPKLLANADSIKFTVFNEEIVIPLDVPAKYTDVSAQIGFKAGFINGFIGYKLQQKNAPAHIRISSPIA